LRYSVFIGRFQPLHAGHKALIRSVLNEGRRVLVLLRPGGHDAANPYGVDERRAMFANAFPEYGHTLLVHDLPVDIAEVCYGRQVGWGIREIRLAPATEAISGTAIREAAR